MPIDPKRGIHTVFTPREEDESPLSVTPVDREKVKGVSYHKRDKRWSATEPLPEGKSKLHYFSSWEEAIQARTVFLQEQEEA